MHRLAPARVNFRTIGSLVGVTMLVLVLVLVSVSETVRVRMRPTPKADRRPRLCLRGFHAAISRRRLRRQRIKQLPRGSRHTLDRAIKCFLVRFRGFRKPTELADELKR